ncbi:hypothetical protein [Hyphobacterium sp.]|uniref:hypothetical protein n=1 Tax=Hyphobacterium sp. TaxID=2004662 RepID=UPI0037481050
MNIFFLKTAIPPVSLRETLLRQSLETYLHSQAHAQISEVSDGDAAVAELEALGAFPAGRHANLALFVGLPNTPEKMLGRNILICTRSLPDELQEFEARNLGSGGASDFWVRNVLSNFDCVILLDHLHFRQSLGLAPFVPMRMANRLPVLLDPTGMSDTPEVAIFDHGAGLDPKRHSNLREGLSQLARATVISPETPVKNGMDILARADLHIHVGFSYFAPIAAITPLDSMSNAIYTIALQETEGANSTKVDSLQEREFQSRSYTEIVYTISDALTRSQKMLERIILMQKKNMVLNRNPEIYRFRQMNKTFIDGRFADLKKVIPH